MENDNGFCIVNNFIILDVAFEINHLTDIQILKPCRSTASVAALAHFFVKNKPYTHGVKPDTAIVKPNIPDVKLNIIDVKLNTANVKPNITDVKLNTADVKPNIANVKLNNGNVGLNNADVGLHTSGVRLKSGDARLANDNTPFALLMDMMVNANQALHYIMTLIILTF